MEQRSILILLNLDRILDTDLRKTQKILSYSRCQIFLKVHYSSIFLNAFCCIFVKTQNSKLQEMYFVFFIFHFFKCLTHMGKLSYKHIRSIRQKLVVLRKLSLPYLGVTN